VRSDFSFGKFANAAPELLLFVSEGEIHGASRQASVLTGGQIIYTTRLPARRGSDQGWVPKLQLGEERPALA
jgi:hypothetical protein